MGFQLPFSIPLLQRIRCSTDEFAKFFRRINVVHTYILLLFNMFFNTAFDLPYSPALLYPLSHPKQFPGDQQLANFVGACADLTQFSIAPHALDFEIGQIPPATMDLQRLVRGPH